MTFRETYPGGLTREQALAQFKYAAQRARSALKPGDRLRVTKCPGTKRWITFAAFDGNWIVSKSGISDYSPRAVDRVNGAPVDFTEGWTP